MLTDFFFCFEVKVYCTTLLIFIESGFEFVEYFSLKAFLQLRFDCVLGFSSDFLLHVAILERIQFISSNPSIGCSIVFDQVSTHCFDLSSSFHPKVFTKMVFNELRCQQSYRS